MPVEMPVTIAVEPTVARAVLLLDHTPPPAALLRAVVDPAQTVVVPVIEPALGSGLTVTAVVALAVPQLLVTE